MQSQCWCGNNNLKEWNAEYARCSECETLIDVVSGPAELAREVRDQGDALYDESYWTAKMMASYKEMGCASLDDVILLHYRERAACWTERFIRHVPAPARVFEMGCGMGTFTKWLHDLGYDVVASELSPGWRKFLRKKLGIRVLPPEAVVAEEVPFDSIVLLDVLEHLPQPRKVLTDAADMLSGKGQLMLQVPEYPAGASYEELVNKNSVFLRMLLPGEHLFLYSRNALTRLLHSCGFTFLAWHPPVFATDMFVFASRGPIRIRTLEETERDFMAMPHSISAYAALKNYQAATEERAKAHTALLRCRAAEAALAKGGVSLGTGAATVSTARGAVQKEAVRRLLYVRLDGIGDGVLAGCLLENMPRLFPNAAITVVCDRASAPLYDGAPGVAAVVALEKGKLRDTHYLQEAVHTLQALGADAVFNGTLSPTAAVCSLLLSVGVPVISTEIDDVNMHGADTAMFASRVTELIPVRKGMRMDLERHGDFLEHFGIRLEKTAPKMWLSDADTADAERFWIECGFPKEKTVAFFAGGGVPQKSYLQYGAALGELFASRGLCVAALGGPGDREVNAKNLEDFAAHGVSVADLTGRGTLRGDAAFVRDCALAVGADTAMAHMACALGIPLVSFVPGANFGRFLPYDTTTTAVCLPLECYGCNWNCQYGTAYCIAGITPETVRQAVEHRLAQEAEKERKTLFMQRPAAWPHAKGLPAWRSPAAFIEAYRSKEPDGLDVVLSR